MQLSIATQPWVGPLPERRALALVVVAEAVSMLLARLALRHYPTALIEVELFRTALRIATAALCWWLFKPLLMASNPNFQSLRQLHPLLAIGLLLSVPVLSSYGTRGDVSVAMVFAATSIAVGIKEEILFRGILQSLLMRWMNPMRAIVLSSSIFTAWHLGVQPLRVDVFAGIFLAGLLLGLLYWRTGSLLAVIAVHALDDIIWSFQYLERPYPPIVGLFILVYAVLLVYHWAHKGSRRPVFN